ncbi:MAG: hypothetical protein K2I06_06565 [Ruminococcus sp.]|nr:hypothetical protein [Ruminococcus sp.]
MIPLEEEICRFVGTSRYCQILVGVKCRGTDELCKFRKTEKQFQEEHDRTILINRAKHNCKKCKYMRIPCRLSSEEGSEENELDRRRPN